MPQLKKVVLGMGNRLIYSDTYDQALALLNGGNGQTESAPPTGNAISSTLGPAPASPAIVDSIRAHMQRYRELQGQGKWSEAGKELEAIQADLNRR